MAALIVLPPVAILMLILWLGVNVPFQDDWDTVDVLAKWHEGTVGFADFWRQHSEHRIPVTRAFIWLLGIFSRYNLVVEMLAGFVFAVLALPLVAALLRRALAGHADHLVRPMTAVASALLFSLVLHENWFSGTASLELFVLRFVTVALVWAFVRWPRETKGVVVAMMCALVGMFAEAAGLALWVTGGVAIWIAYEGERRRVLVASVWAFVAATVIWLYVHGLAWDQPDSADRFAHAIRFALFTTAGLGLPFAYGTSAEVCAAVGAFGCGAMVLATWSIARTRPDAVRNLIPMLLLALQGLLGAMLIALGRSMLETKYAMTSHYAFGSSLFWVAVIAIVALAFAVAPVSAEPARRIVTYGVAAAALVLCVGFVNANLAGYDIAYTTSRNLDMALASLYSADQPPTDVARFLYPPDEDRVRRQIARLKRLRLGPFAASTNQVARHRQDGTTKVAPPGSRDGFFDGGDCSRALGWAWDPAHPTARVDVEVWHGAIKLGVAAANWFRRDLLKAGIGDGQHAFVYYFPSTLPLGTGESISVTYAGTSAQLRGSPTVVMCR